MTASIHAVYRHLFYLLGHIRILDEPWGHLDAYFGWYPDGMRLSTHLRDSSPDLTETQLSHLVNLVQQICWMSLVLSASRIGPEPATAGVVLSNLYPPKPSTTMATVDLVVKYTRIAEDQESLCWLKLFKEPVLALGFPVPSRTNEIGLEMPLKLMATICGARHFVDFQGGILIKGLSSMLIPTARLNGGNIVQWHLVSKESGDDEDIRLSYLEGLNICANRLTIKELNFESLSKTRAVLGWCRWTKTIFDDPNYSFDEITYTGLVPQHVRQFNCQSSI